MPAFAVIVPRKSRPRQHPACSRAPLTLLGGETTAGSDDSNSNCTMPTPQRRRELGIGNWELRSWELGAVSVVRQDREVRRHSLQPCWQAMLARRVLQRNAEAVGPATFATG